MSLTAKQIIQLMEKAKELGLKQVRVDGFEASFQDLKEEKPILVVPDMKAEDLVKPISILDEPTDEEIRFWSTPYYDVIQAEKEAHKKKLSEEARG